MPDDTSKSPTDLIPIKEAARRLDISERTLRRIRQRGEIEVVQASPGRIKVSEAVLAAYIKKNTFVERTRRRASKRGRRS